MILSLSHACSLALTLLFAYLLHCSIVCANSFNYQKRNDLRHKLGAIDPQAALNGNSCCISPSVCVWPSANKFTYSKLTTVRDGERKRGRGQLDSNSLSMPVVVAVVVVVKCGSSVHLHNCHTDCLLLMSEPLTNCRHCQPMLLLLLLRPWQGQHFNLPCFSCRSSSKCN